MLRSKTICHQGLVREQNEDSYVSNSDGSFWLVADGVGGNVGGDIASQLAVQTVERHIRQGAGLTDAITSANEAVLSAVAMQPELQGMATTIVAAQFEGKKFELAWVGDSRGYLIDANTIRQLSSDHNHANELFLNGDISKEESLTHSGQHELTQALGQLSLADVPCLTGTLEQGSVLLLCTDGLSGVLNDKDILNTFTRLVSLEDISDALLSQALEAGAPDNVTFTLVSWEEADGRHDDLVAEQKINKRRSINKTPITWVFLSIVALIMMILFYVD